MPKLKRERAVVSCFFAFFFHSPLVSLHKGALQIWHPSGFYPIYKSGARPVQLSTGETCCVVVFIVNNFRGILAVCLRLVCDAPHQKMREITASLPHQSKTFMATNNTTRWR